MPRCAGFDGEEVKRVALAEMERVLNDVKYSPKLSSKLCNEIIKSTLSKLELNDDAPMKYVTHMTIAPRSFSNYSAFTYNMWNDETDSCVCINYENNTLKCHFIIWGIKMWQ